MNGPTTISKVIAFELGLLIAVLVWIAFAGIPGVKTHPVAETQEPVDASFANVSSTYQPTKAHRRVAVTAPVPAPVDYPADDTQVAQVPAKYPVASVQTYDPGLTGGTYDDTVDARGQLSYAVDEPAVEGYVVNEDPANYIGTFPEPVLDSPYDYYYGRPCGYSQPVQVVILNNNRGFGRRNGGNRFNFVGRTASAPQQNPRIRPRTQGGQTVTRPSPGVRGPRMHPGPRIHAGNVNPAPRRIAAVQKARAGQTPQARHAP
jgi:hypothetical protein